MAWKERAYERIDMIVSGRVAASRYIKINLVRMLNFERRNFVTTGIFTLFRLIRAPMVEKRAISLCRSER